MSKAYIVAAEDMEFVKRYFYVWVPANISEETVMKSLDVASWYAADFDDCLSVEDGIVAYDAFYPIALEKEYWERSGIERFIGYIEEYCGWSVVAYTPPKVDFEFCW